MGKRVAEAAVTGLHVGGCGGGGSIGAGMGGGVACLEGGLGSVPGRRCTWAALPGKLAGPRDGGCVQVRCWSSGEGGVLMACTAGRCGRNKSAYFMVNQCTIMSLAVKGMAYWLLAWLLEMGN